MDATPAASSPLWRVDPSGHVRPWLPSAAAAASTSTSAAASATTVWMYADAGRPRGPVDVHTAVAGPQRPRSQSRPSRRRSPSGAPSATAASSTERGRKFRKRLQERELQARADIELLRQQIVRMQALQRQQRARPLLALASTAEMRVDAALGATADGGSALRFVREYFALFRNGVVNQSTPRLQGGEIVLDSSRQEAFLSAWTEPDVKFDEFVGMRPMIDQWRRYSAVHSFIKLDPVSMELQTADGLATVVAKGVLHIRYARRTIENVFPHLATVAPDLVERLVGRLVHMHYTSHYFFNEQGRLVNQQIVPDFVSALKEVLGSLNDVSRVLDSSLLHEHVLGEVDYDRFQEVAESRERDPSQQHEQQHLDQSYQAQQQQQQHYEQRFEQPSQLQMQLEEDKSREPMGRCDQTPTASSGMGLSFLLS